MEISEIAELIPIIAKINEEYQTLRQNGDESLSSLDLNSYVLQKLVSIEEWYEEPEKLSIITRIRERVAIDRSDPCNDIVDGAINANDLEITDHFVSNTIMKFNSKKLSVKKSRFMDLNFDDIPSFEPLGFKLMAWKQKLLDVDLLRGILEMDFAEFIDHHQWDEFLRLLYNTMSISQGEALCLTCKIYAKLFFVLQSTQFLEAALNFLNHLNQIWCKDRSCLASNYPDGYIIEQLLNVDYIKLLVSCVAIIADKIGSNFIAASEKACDCAMATLLSVLTFGKIEVEIDGANPFFVSLLDVLMIHLGGSSGFSRCLHMYSRIAMISHLIHTSFAHCLFQKLTLVIENTNDLLMNAKESTQEGTGDSQCSEQLSLYSWSMKYNISCVSLYLSLLKLTPHEACESSQVPGMSIKVFQLLSVSVNHLIQRSQALEANKDRYVVHENNPNLLDTYWNGALEDKVNIFGSRNMQMVPMTFFGKRHFCCSGSKLSVVALVRPLKSQLDGQEAMETTSNKEKTTKEDPTATKRLEESECVRFTEYLMEHGEFNDPYEVLNMIYSAVHMFFERLLIEFQGKLVDNAPISTDEAFLSALDSVISLVRSFLGIAIHYHNDYYCTTISSLWKVFVAFVGDFVSITAGREDMDIYLVHDRFMSMVMVHLVENVYSCEKTHVHTFANIMFDISDILFSQSAFVTPFHAMKVVDSSIVALLGRYLQCFSHLMECDLFPLFVMNPCLNDLSTPFNKNLLNVVRFVLDMCITIVENYQNKVECLARSHPFKSRYHTLANELADLFEVFSGQDDDVDDDADDDDLSTTSSKHNLVYTTKELMSNKQTLNTLKICNLEFDRDMSMRSDMELDSSVNNEFDCNNNVITEYNNRKTSLVKIDEEQENEAVTNSNSGSDSDSDDDSADGEYLCNSLTQGMFQLESRLSCQSLSLLTRASNNLVTILCHDTPNISLYTSMILVLMTQLGEFPLTPPSDLAKVLVPGWSLPWTNSPLRAMQAILIADNTCLALQRPLAVSLIRRHTCQLLKDPQSLVGLDLCTQGMLGSLQEAASLLRRGGLVMDIVRTVVNDMQDDEIDDRDIHIDCDYVNNDISIDTEADSGNDGTDSDLDINMALSRIDQKCCNVFHLFPASAMPSTLSIPEQFSFVSEVCRIEYNDMDVNTDEIVYNVDTLKGLVSVDLTNCQSEVFDRKLQWALRCYYLDRKHHQQEQQTLQVQRVDGDHNPCLLVESLLALVSLSNTKDDSRFAAVVNHILYSSQWQRFHENLPGQSLLLPMLCQYIYERYPETGLSQFVCGRCILFGLVVIHCHLTVPLWRLYRGERGFEVAMKVINEGPSALVQEIALLFVRCAADDKEISEMNVSDILRYLQMKLKQ